MSVKLTHSQVLDEIIHIESQIEKIVEQICTQSSSLKLMNSSLVNLGGSKPDCDPVSLQNALHLMSEATVCLCNATERLRWYTEHLEMKEPTTEEISDGGEKFNYEELDPGIRETVKFLHSFGYRTTDSGDGVSKPAADPTLTVYDDYLPYPHVVVKTSSPEGAIMEARHIADALEVCGNLNKKIEPGDITLQYDPIDDTSVIIISNITVGKRDESALSVEEINKLLEEGQKNTKELYEKFTADQKKGLQDARGLIF